MLGYYGTLRLRDYWTASIAALKALMQAVACFGVFLNMDYGFAIARFVQNFSVPSQLYLMATSHVLLLFIGSMLEDPEIVRWSNFLEVKERISSTW